MAISKRTKPYHAMVMRLNAFRPMTPQQRWHDRAFAALLVTCCIVIPLIAYPAALFLGKVSPVVACATLILPIGFGVGLGLLNRRRIISSFFTVEDVDEHMELYPVTSRAHFWQLARVPMLAFYGQTDESGRLFIYNWLRARRALTETGRVLAYVMEGEQLVAYLDSTMEADANVLLIPESELSIPTDSIERIQFENELLMIGGTHLATVIDRVRNAQEQPALAKAAESAAPVPTKGDEFLSNKGGKLA